MQQIRIHAPGEVSLDEVASPEPGRRDVVLRVVACGICGSDLGYIRLGGVAGPRPEPTPLGHEFSAVVDRVGADVTRVRVGERVVVNPIAGGNVIGNGGDAGAFSPEVLVRDVESGGVLFPIPDDLPFDRAALAEPLGVGMHAVDRAGVVAGDKVAIFGAGPIGLMALATLKHRGIEKVAIIDLSEKRLSIARELGADFAINARDGKHWDQLREAHGTALFMNIVPTTGTDAYIEASGAASVIKEIIEQARPRARMSVVALHREARSVNFMSLMAKEITIAGSMAYPDDYSEMLRLLSEVDLSPAITHRFPLDSFDEALDIASNAEVAGKVMIEL